MFQMEVNLNIAVCCFAIHGEGSSPGKSADKGDPRRWGEWDDREAERESGSKGRLRGWGKAESISDQGPNWRKFLLADLSLL